MYEFHNCTEKKRTVKVHKLQEAPWDTAVDEDVEEALGNYKKEFHSMMKSIVPQDIILPSEEECALDKEAQELAAEMGLE